MSMEQALAEQQLLRVELAKLQERALASDRRIANVSGVGSLQGGKAFAAPPRLSAAPAVYAAPPSPPAAKPLAMALATLKKPQTTKELKERVSDLLNDAKLLKGHIQKAWKKIAGSEQTSLDLSGLEALCGEIERTIGVPRSAFGSLPDTYQCFDFNGDGSLDFLEGYRCVKRCMATYRKNQGLESPINVPTKTPAEAGFTVIRVLASGGQGEASLVRSRTGEQVVLKTYSRANANAGGLSELLDEAEHMMQVGSCPNVAHCMEIFQDSKNFYMISGANMGGDFTSLTAKAKQAGVSITEDWCRGVFKQAFHALSHLHFNALTHCDIKEPNMMCRDTNYEKPHVVIIDLGLSQAFTTPGGGPSGTPGYIPPETWASGKWFPRGDIFSMGVVILQLLTDKTPDPKTGKMGIFTEGCRSMDDVTRATQSRQPPFSQAKPSSPQLLEWLQPCLEKSKNRRPRAPQVLDNPWFAGAPGCDDYVPMQLQDSFVSNSGASQAPLASPQSAMRSMRPSSPRQQLSQSQLVRSARPGLGASDVGLGLSKAALESAMQSSSGKSVEVWEEPPQNKTSMSEIDRCETHLKEAFMKHPALAKKSTTNPLHALTSLLNSLDTNHTGKLDMREFKEVCRFLKFQASDSATTGLFHRYDLDRSGYLTIDEFGKLLLKEGGAETKAKTCIARMREVLSLRAGGFPSMKAMGSQFRIIDRDRSGKLSKEEFSIALDILFKAYKVTFTSAEKNSLFSFFDRDQAGGVNYDEYIRAVRGDMSDFRLGLVKQAFGILDKDGSGVVTMADLTSTYDVSQNPAVKGGKMSAGDAYTAFMNNYDTNQDGQVTFEEFVESYNWVSASIDTDDYFELMMRNAWHITGGEGWCQNTSNLRVLVEHLDGSEEVVEILDDLGLDKKDYQAVMGKLRGQGVKNIRGFKLAA